MRGGPEAARQEAARREARSRRSRSGKRRAEAAQGARTRGRAPDELADVDLWRHGCRQRARKKIVREAGDIARHEETCRGSSGAGVPASAARGFRSGQQERAAAAASEVRAQAPARRPGEAQARRRPADERRNAPGEDPARQRRGKRRRATRGGGGSPPRGARWAGRGERAPRGRRKRKPSGAGAARSRRTQARQGDRARQARRDARHRGRHDAPRTRPGPSAGLHCASEASVNGARACSQARWIVSRAFRVRVRIVRRRLWSAGWNGVKIARYSCSCVL
jgi:hypothetical protein